MSDAKIINFNRALAVSNALESVFDNPTYVRGGPLDRLCEKACSMTFQASAAADMLERARNEFRQLLTDIANANADSASKAAVKEAWLPCLYQLDAAVKALGRS